MEVKNDFDLKRILDNFKNIKIGVVEEQEEEFNKISKQVEEIDSRKVYPAF